jgi:hypothetical protein
VLLRILSVKAVVGGRIRGVRVAGFGLWAGKIRVLESRILREGWDADFGAGDGNGLETIRYNSNQLCRSAGSPAFGARILAVKDLE